MSLQLNDANDTVAQWRVVMNKRFGPLYTRLMGPLPVNTNVFGARAQAWQQEYERRTNQPVDGIVSDADLTALGIAFKNPPIFFTVEGHMSDMFSGPVSDTAAELEREGLCRHQPIGYNSGALPFDNQSGVNELARLVGATVLDNGIPFPPGTKWALGGFSQGAIVVYDFHEQHLDIGCDLEWREKDRVGTLAYGNPCRATNSIAPWARSQINTAGTHGLDPSKRYGLPGCAPVPPNFMDDYREGDIFAENGDDLASQMKSAVYEAVARSDFFSSTSLLPQIAKLYSQPLESVVAIFEAIISGIVFLADQPSPHYSPYDITGGVNWMRTLLKT